MTSRIFVSFFIIILLSSGCTVRSNEVDATTSAPALVTVTLPPQPASPASETPLPVPPQPTVTPIDGTASTQINVRAEPSTASNVLGIIAADTKVQILGKDPGGNWLQILYPQGVDGKGWVTARYITLAAGIEIPVIGGGGANGDGNVAIVQQQLNVRSGPGTSFNSLGTLNAQDVVDLTGKDTNGTWLQIEFPSGPDGKGWVNAAFVQAKGVEHLPIITEAGQVIGTATPTGVPATPTPTVIPAMEDYDSEYNTSASVVFEPLGTGALIYGGDVSTPDGDSQDWVGFTPYADFVFASLDCVGGENLQVEFLENGTPMALQLACGDQLKRMDVTAGFTYLVQLQIRHTAEKLQYIRYTIKIQTSP